MSAIVNARDILLQGTVPRMLPSISKSLLLDTDAVVFQVAVGGAGSPSTINLVATPLGLAGTASFVTSPVTTLGGSGNVRTLAFSDMSTNSVTVTASIVENGVTYESVKTITKVFDGADGTNGSDGATGTSAISSQLTSTSAVFAADSTGLVDAPQSFSTTITVLSGIIDDTSNWTITRNASDVSITTSILGAVVTVTDMGTLVDTGYVDVIATRTGYPTQTLRMTLAKAKRSTPSSGPVASFIGLSGYEHDLGPGNPSVYAQLSSDGTTDSTDSTGNWYLPTTSGIGTDYYVRATISSSSIVGATFTGVTGSWVSLSAGRTWTLSRSTDGNAQIVLFIQTSESSTGSPVAGSGYAYLEVDRGVIP